MLKNDTLKNGTSRIGLYGSAPPGILDQHAAQSVGYEEESKKIHFCIKSKRV